LRIGSADRRRVVIPVDVKVAQLLALDALRIPVRDVGVHVGRRDADEPALSEVGKQVLLDPTFDDREAPLPVRREVIDDGARGLRERQPLGVRDDREVVRARADALLEQSLGIALPVALGALRLPLAVRALVGDPPRAVAALLRARAARPVELVDAAAASRAAPLRGLLLLPTPPYAPRPA
jgi:hypothetical protein